MIDAPRGLTAGVTLVEVMVALLLVSAISMAGFFTLDQIIRTQQQTELRLRYVGEIQRALHVLSRDLMQAKPGTLEVAEGALTFQRATSLGPRVVQYEVRDAALNRTTMTQDGRNRSRQELMFEVDDVFWQVYDTTRGWTDRWPPEPEEESPTPSAVLAQIVISTVGLSGPLERMAPLPAEPKR